MNFVIMIVRVQLLVTAHVVILWRGSSSTKAPPHQGHRRSCNNSKLYYKVFNFLIVPPWWFNSVQLTDAVSWSRQMEIEILLIAFSYKNI